MAAADGPSLPLPADAVAEILIRLPARSIARFRTVCRAWNAIPSHPGVDRVLAGRTATVTAIMKSPIWLSVVEHDLPVDVLRVDRFRGRWNPDVHRTEPSPRGLSLGDTIISTMDFRSWDGVLCTRAFPRTPPLGAAADHYLLWNPLTDACAVVAAPAGAQGRLIGGYANPVTGRFHLLHSSDVAVPGDGGLVVPITVRVLGVGDGNGWREVPLPSSPFSMRGERDHSVSLHGNLHWLVRRDSGTAAAALLVFDTAREEFRFMAAPPERPELDLATARARAVPGGKLCVIALTAKQPPPVAMEVWVLDDYSDPRTWRLRETARLDGGAAGLSPARFAAAGAVEVVEGANEGEEVFIHQGRGIDAYSVRSKVWRKVSVSRSCASLLVYRESVVQPEMSFGRALRGFSSGRACRISRHCSYESRPYTSADFPLEWSIVERVLDDSS